MEACIHASLELKNRLTEVSLGTSETDTLYFLLEYQMFKPLFQVPLARHLLLRPSQEATLVFNIACINTATLHQYISYMDYILLFPLVKEETDLLSRSTWQYIAKTEEKHLKFTLFTSHLGRSGISIKKKKSRKEYYFPIFNTSSCADTNKSCQITDLKDTSVSKITFSKEE